MVQMKAQMQVIINEVNTAPSEMRRTITSLDDPWNDINRSVQMHG